MLDLLKHSFSYLKKSPQLIIPAAIFFMIENILTAIDKSKAIFIYIIMSWFGNLFIQTLIAHATKSTHNEPMNIQSVITQTNRRFFPLIKTMLPISLLLIAIYIVLFSNIESLNNPSSLSNTQSLYIIVSIVGLSILKIINDFLPIYIVIVDKGGFKTLKDGLHHMASHSRIIIRATLTLVSLSVLSLLISIQALMIPIIGQAVLYSIIQGGRKTISYIFISKLYLNLLNNKSIETTA